MKKNRRVLALVLTILVSGCRDTSAPTAPLAPTAPVIGGDWSGTVKSLAVVDPWDIGPMCSEQPVTFEINQAEGVPLNGSIRAQCITAHFKLGKIVNGKLQGTLTFEQAGLTYTGTLTATLEGSPVSRISADTSYFYVSKPAQRQDSIRLELTR